MYVVIFEQANERRELIQPSWEIGLNSFHTDCFSIRSILVTVSFSKVKFRIGRTVSFYTSGK